MILQTTKIRSRFSSREWNMILSSPQMSYSEIAVYEKKIKVFEIKLIFLCLWIWKFQMAILRLLLYVHFSITRITSCALKRFAGQFTVWKSEKLTHFWKKFVKTYYKEILYKMRWFHIIFTKKMLRGNFCNFHTVQELEMAIFFQVITFSKRGPFNDFYWHFEHWLQ